MTEFNFEEFMVKAALNESSEQHRRLYLCPEAIGLNHSAPDAYGNCTWCGKKIAAKRIFYRDKHTRPDLDLYYNYTYNPDGI